MSEIFHQTPDQNGNIVKTVAGTRFFNKWVEIVLAVISIVQGLAFSDLAQRLPAIFDYAINQHDYVIAVYYAYCFAILLRVFQTYVLAALDYEEWSVSFGDVFVIFVIGSIEYVIFSTLTIPKFNPLAFHSRVIWLSGLGIVAYLLTLARLRRKQFPLASLYSSEVSLQRINICGGLIMFAASAIVLWTKNPRLFLGAGIVGAVTPLLNIWISLKKTLSLRVQIVSLHSLQAPDIKTTIAPRPYTVRPAMVSDISEIANLLSKEFYYVYEALFETSPALTSELLTKLLVANAGKHNLGYKSFFVSVTPEEQRVAGIMLLTPAKKYGLREAIAMFRFLLTLLRYLGLPRVFRVLGNLRMLSTIVPISESGETSVAYIAVVPELRRQTVASSLLRFALAYAEGTGSHTVVAEIRDTNEAGRLLFRQNGFIEVAELKSASDSLLTRGPRVLVKRTIRAATEVIMSASQTL